MTGLLHACFLGSGMLTRVLFILAGRSLPSLDLTSSYLPLPTPSSRLPLTRPASPSTDAHPALQEEENDQQLANPSATEGNRGNKLKVGSRWVRKGKAVAWGMGYGEREVKRSATSLFWSLES